MSTATAEFRRFDSGDVAGSLAPKRRFDPFGLATGFRAYRIYSQLELMTDAELARMGLDRASMGRFALETAAAERAA